MEGEGEKIGKLKACLSYMRPCPPKQNKKFPSHFFHA